MGGGLGKGVGGIGHGGRIKPDYATRLSFNMERSRLPFIKDSLAGSGELCETRACYCIKARNVAGIYANAVVAGARFRRRGHVQPWLPALHQPPAELQPTERWSQRGNLVGSAALDGIGSLLDTAQHAARPPR